MGDIQVYEPYVISNTLKDLFEEEVRKNNPTIKDPYKIEELAAEEFEKFLKFQVQLYFKSKL